MYSFYSLALLFRILTESINFYRYDITFYPLETQAEEQKRVFLSQKGPTGIFQNLTKQHLMQTIQLIIQQQLIEIGERYSCDYILMNRIKRTKYLE